MRLKGSAGARFKPAHTFDELYGTYKLFAEAEVRKAKERTGQQDIRPDPFHSFIAERTDLCFHGLFTPLTYYWIETVSICESEMGLTLPGPMDEIPGLFWDCLGIVRSAKAQVRKEEKK